MSVFFVKQNSITQIYVYSKVLLTGNN